MSSDKDSVAPEWYFIHPNLSTCRKGDGPNPCPYCGETVPYIRDDGDLISRSAVISDGWKPIESAPNATIDRPIIVAEIKPYGVTRCALVRKTKGGLFTVSGGEQCKHWATHWISPPPLPKENQ